MDLRHLRYFVAVAEELHFTRAADRLGIRQPPLSMQIKQLERQIGAPLFRRLSRGVELTAAGESFLVDTRNILSRLDDAIAAAESMARGQTGRLRVGFGGATYLPDLVPAGIMRYRSLYPGVFLSPEQSNTPSLVHGLREGRIDVAFIRPPIGDSEGLVIDVFFEEDMVVVLPVGHALGREKSVSLSDISKETFILFPQDIGPGLHGTIVTACMESGFSPQIGQNASQIVSIVPMIAAGFGVSLVPRSVTSLSIKGVTYHSITGSILKAPISLARRAGDRSVALDHFIKAFLDFSRK